MSAECSAENIPPGYKQTEVGVIPEDWSSVTISDVAVKVGSGITPRGGSSNYKEYGRPFVRSQNIGWGILLLTDLVYIDDDTHKSFSSTELRQGDVLLNITGASIGRSAIADARLSGGNVNQHVCIIRTEATEVDPHFLNYILLSAQGQRQIDSFQAGGNREGLNFGQIRSIRFSIPSTLAEQKTIAEALSDTDTLIEFLEQLIAKKHQIKQGAMQELLTGKRRLPGFEIKRGQRQTEIGKIPKDWDTVTLANATLTGGLVRGPFGGALKKELFVESGYKVYEQRNAIYGTVKDGNYFIDSSKYKELERFCVRPGDFIVSCSGTIGCIYQIPVGSPEGVINQALLKISLNKAIVDDAFFLSVFRSKSFQERIKENSHGGAMQNLVGMDIFRNTKFQLPSKVEQKAIATILSDMDSEITALEEKLAKAHQVKQGMIQELLTGRIRLI